MSIQLRGITWAHSRGYTPLVAASQRFMELNKGVEISWDKRSLQHFADYPLEKLVNDYDLLIIDYPWTGCAATNNYILPVSEHLEPDFLEDQRMHTVGKSFASYSYLGKQWAIPIDAATPVASCRLDLLQRNYIDVPTNWDQVMELAKQGRVAIPAIPIDVLMNFYSFCIAMGTEPFQSEYEVVPFEKGIEAMQLMHTLYKLLPESMFTKNPIDVAELMAQTDDYWYCPFAYGYSNYSRLGYAPSLLHYRDVVTYNGQNLCTTIGGTGLAVSAYTKNVKESMEFVSYVCNGLFQKTMYLEHGGQPGHLDSWKDEHANILTNNFFSNCLPTMERGYMRPRYNGYLHFQDKAGTPLQQFLLGRLTANEALCEMNIYYKESKNIEKEVLHGITS